MPITVTESGSSTRSFTISGLDADAVIQALYDLAVAQAPAGTTIPAMPDFGAGEGDSAQVLIAGQARLSNGNGEIVSLSFVDKEAS